MDRRELLKGVSAASVVGGLFGPQAFASSELSLEERLALLEQHTRPGAACFPSPLVHRGLASLGLSETTLSDILSGLLFATVFKECSEQEQQDARWLPVMERIVPRFTESLAALMERMEGRTDSRAVRRMLRRPNKLARVVNGALIGKPRSRVRELRQAMGALASEPSSLEDLYEGMELAAQAAGTTTLALVPSSAAAEDLEPGSEEEKEGRLNSKQKKLLIGLLLLLGSPLVLALGLFVGILGGIATGSGLGLTVLAVALCVVTVIMVISAIVLVVQVVTEERASSEEPEELSDTDLLLLGDVEDLLAA